MKRVIKTLCSLLLVTAMTVGIYPMTSTATIDPAEYCVPVLKQYTTTSGTWKPSDGTRFYIVVSDANTNADEELVEMMYTVAKEFVAKGYTTCTQVVYGTENAALPTDFLIKKGTTGVPSSVKSGIKDQSYKIEIGTQRATITYQANIGAFYAFTTILQVLTYTNNAMPCGTVVDYPDLEIRAAQIDIARKYYTPTWLKNYVKELAWLKYNEITFHISEDQGMRLESKTYSGYAGSRLFQSSIEGGFTDPDAGKYLTQAEMTEIVKTAFEYQVDVVPSFDSPGHMNYLLGKHYEKTGKNLGNSFTYNGSTSQPSISEYRVRAIDLTNSAARNFALDFYKEFGKFFADLGCTKFNIGGDELFGWSVNEIGGQKFFISGGVSNTNYKSNWEANQHWATYAQNTLKITNGTAYDTFISYMNEVADMLKANYGYTTIRCFSDEIYHPVGAKNAHVSLNEDIEICFWSNGTNYFAPFSTFTSNNRILLNCVEDNAYYVLTVENGTKKSFDSLHPALSNGGETIYNKWNGSTFYDTYQQTNTSNTIDISSDKNVGSVFFIWCDSPWVETETEVYNNIKPLIRSFAAKMWSSNAQTGLSYSEFKTVYNKIGQAPLYNKTSTATIPEIIHGDTKTTVTVKYYLDSKLDSNRTVTLSGYNGHSYSVDVKSIPNYAYTECSGGELSGTFTDTNITISLYYVKIDLSSLQNYVDRFIPSYFAQSGYEGYLEAYYQAKSVLEKSTPTGEEIDAAIEKLQTVIRDMKRSQVRITIEHYDSNGNKIQADTEVWVEMATSYDITTHLISGKTVKYTTGSQMGYISATPITIKVTYN